MTGSNDGPVFQSGPATAELGEAAGQAGSAALLSAAGTLAFSDADLRDTHTVSASFQSLLTAKGTHVPSATQQALKSALNATLVQDSTNGAGGSLSWNFGIADRLVDFLGAGETATAIYQITVNDGHGGKATQSVKVTLTGANDGPVISQSTLRSDDDDDHSAGVSGRMTFTDADASDVHSATVVLKSLESTAGAPDLAPALAQAVRTSVHEQGESANGSLTWRLELPDNLPHLATGQSALVTYEVTLSDNHGGTAAPQTISLLQIGRAHV